MDVLILDRRLHGAVPPRHAGRLRAGPLRDHRGAVDRPAARSHHDQDVRRHGRLPAARHPVLHPGRRHHGRGRHGRAHHQPRQGVRRLHPRRAGAGQHPGLDHVRRHLGLVRRRHRLDRLGDDPADDQGGLSAPVRRQRHHLGLAAAAADPALAQRGDLFAGRRRDRVGRPPVHGRRHPGPAARAVADDPVPHHRPPPELPQGRGDPAAPGAVHRLPGDLGPGHRGHHPRRHPVGHLHADRIGGGRLRLCLPGHDVRLPRLQVARPAGC